MGEGDPQSTDTITREQILARARSFIGHGTYKLGRGGFNPASPTPWATSSELCDCVAGGSMVWTQERGLVPIEEVDAGDVVQSRAEDGSRVAANVYALLRKGEKSVLRIKTPRNSIHVTSDHKILRVARESRRERTASGRFGRRIHDTEWVSADRLERDDLIFRSTPHYGVDESVTLPNDLAFLLGVYLGDGSCGQFGNGISICVYDDLADRVQKILRDLFAATSATSKSRGVYTNCEPLRYLLAISGLNVDSTRKRVPQWLWRARPDFIRSFIDGYVASDGHEQWYRSYKVWSLGSCNETLLRQVRGLCDIAGYRYSDVSTHERTKPIVIKGRTVKTALPLHTFEIYPDSKRHSTSHLYSAKQFITEGFAPVRVSSIEDSGKRETFDLMLDAPHNFAANDLVVHNCSGFVSWCINEPRENPAIAGGWIETTAMVADATGPHAMFTLVDGAAQPGDILVYGDHRVRASDQHLVFQQGHTGIVSQVDAVGHPYKAIHCSKGNFERLNHAIEETSANIFLCNNAVVIRPNKVVS